MICEEEKSNKKIIDKLPLFFATVFYIEIKKDSNRFCFGSKKILGFLQKKKRRKFLNNNSGGKKKVQNWLGKKVKRYLIRSKSQKNREKKKISFIEDLRDDEATSRTPHTRI